MIFVGAANGREGVLWERRPRREAAFRDEDVAPTDLMSSLSLYSFAATGRSNKPTPNYPLPKQ